jgi:hypothetical protein
MKYLTKEWYEEAQILNSVLSFPETEEEWKNEIAWFEARSMDILDIRKRQLSHWTPVLLRVLPPDFHPAVEDGTLAAVYPSEEIRTRAARLQAAFDARTDALRAEYRDHFNAIRSSLPPNAVRLHEKSPHDARIRSVGQPSPDTLIMERDCNGALFHDTDVRLTFTGVRWVEGAFPPPGSNWMTDEVFLADGGFEFHMLFDFPVSEFTLSAADVEISFLR